MAPLAGTVGAIASGVLFYTDPAPYLAVIVGTALALAVEAMEESGTLVRETSTLKAKAEASEQQAQWLEQRTALARELHDVVGHHVTAMVVQAEAGKVGAASDAFASLDAVADLGRTALGELDSLVVHLRDPDAPLMTSGPPRLADVDLVLAAPLRRQGVDVTVRLDPRLATPGALGDVETLTAYRIVQECLTNVSRHAGASAAWVELEPLGRYTRLRVSDDGSGPPFPDAYGTGLLGVGERVTALGGMWTVEARPGGGTTVDVFIPGPHGVPA